MGAPVQTNETSAAAAATTIAVAQGSNPTAGNVNIVWVRGPSASSVTGVADTLGNTYTARGNVTEAGTGQVLYQFTASITTGGAANTVTATYNASTSNRGITVTEAVGTYDASNTGTDTGNNPTTAVSATNSAQPATLYMLCNDVQGGTPAVGTGFTNIGTGWATLGLNYRAQYKTVTSVGSQSGDFGNAGFDRCNTGLVILLDASAPAITVQPADQTVNAGDTANFSVTATGATSYQWKKNGSNVGTNSSSYSLTAAYADQGAQITVDCINGTGTTTSSAATLRVAFNLAGTGQRAETLLGNGAFAAGAFESYLRGTAAAGGSHATTGALASQAATLAGSAAHLTLHPTSGALASQAATIAGTADHRTLHTTTGSLSAQAATIAGSAAHQNATTGALAAQAATIAGSAAHLTLHTSTGALSSQAATISGAAQHQHAATGALSAQAATIAGSADHTTAGASHSTSGALAAQDATLAGSATHLTLHTTSGALAAQASTIAGAAAHQHVTTGALAAQAATVAGTAAHLTLHTSTGALSSQPASIAGAAAHEHATSGALASQAATISGTAAHTSAGTFNATGTLQAQEAQISGLAEVLHITVEPSGGGGLIYSPARAWRGESDEDRRKRWLRDGLIPAPITKAAPKQSASAVTIAQLEADLAAAQAAAERFKAQARMEIDAERSRKVREQLARQLEQELYAVHVIREAYAEAVRLQIEENDIVFVMSVLAQA